MHEKLKEKAFEEYQKEELAEEGKAIDGLVSFTYNAKQ
jgi:flagellar biosynthesis chaperone FliJ